MITAERLIKLYNMKPLPGEGGYYTETYRSKDILDSSALPERYGRNKACSTAILYLLTPDQASNFHRLPSDELYHFYLGDPVQMIQLFPDGTSKVQFLGHDLEAGQFAQALAPCGVWQGSFLLEGGSFALMGTTVAPGFDFSDHEIAVRNTLLDLYPSHRESILKLTPE